MAKEYYERMQDSIEKCLEDGGFTLTEYPERYIFRMTALNNIEFWDLEWSIERNREFIIKRFRVNAKCIEIPLSLSNHIAKISAEYAVMRKMAG